LYTFLLLIVLLTFQTDRRSGKPKIWMYKDKITGKPKGEATVTYDDANASRSAIDWFDGRLQYLMTLVQYCVERCMSGMTNVLLVYSSGKDFKGSIIKVQMAQHKNNYGGGRGGRGSGRGGGGGMDRGGRGGGRDSGRGESGGGKK
jgi:RNA-binding protein FUS